MDGISEAGMVEVKASDVVDAATDRMVRAELDVAITTARAYPRSLARFKREVTEMVTLDAETAAECLYALPRRDSDTGQTKAIEGPSARLAEIVASAWGNNRAGAKIIEEGDTFVVALGSFHDLERNVQITFEARRRIVGRNGRRFSSDMIGVTANAACSIALRNAVFKGVPKAFWSSAYEAARRVVAGDAGTLSKRRAEAIQYLKAMKVPEDRVYAALGVSGIEDVGLEELVTLRGIVTSIREGETTVGDAFPDPRAKDAAVTARSGVAGLKSKLAAPAKQDDVAATPNDTQDAKA